MISERGMRAKVLKKLELLGAFPIENAAHPGTPDIGTTIGYIELKLATIPGNAEQLVSVKLRPAQRLWLRRWSRLGGVASVLTLGSDSKWYLHEANWAAERFSRSSLVDFHLEAFRVWSEEPNSTSFIDGLRAYYESYRE